MTQESKHYEFSTMFDDELIELSKQTNKRGVHTDNANKAQEELCRRHGKWTSWKTIFGITWPDENNPDCTYNGTGGDDV